MSLRAAGLAAQCFLLFVLWPVPRAEAFFSEIWDYVKQYQLGIDYTKSYDDVTASYSMAKPGGAGAQPTDSCMTLGNQPERQTCSVDIRAGSSSGYGFFLQQAFRRHGLFYFKPDIGFGARYLNGAMTQTEADREKALGLPLKQMSFSLFALIVRPSITLGITPLTTFPDFLFTIGPAAQVAVGKVKVNDKAENVGVATTSEGLIGGFYQIELVFWRFGDGALSVFEAEDFTSSKRGSKFYPKDVGSNDDPGQMQDIRAKFSRSVSGGVLGLGAKLVLDWP